MSGGLADQVVRFARALRRAGIPVGPAAVVDALKAVEFAGVDRRDDFYWALHAILVTRRDQHAVFDEVFRLFWRAAAPSGVADRPRRERRSAEEHAHPGRRAPRRRGGVRGAQRRRHAAAAGDRDRRPPHRLGERGAEAARLRADERRRDRRGGAADRQARDAGRAGRDAADAARRRRRAGSTRGRRSAPASAPAATLSCFATGGRGGGSRRSSCSATFRAR